MLREGWCDMMAAKQSTIPVEEICQARQRGLHPGAVTLERYTKNRDAVIVSAVVAWMITNGWTGGPYPDMEEFLATL